MQRQFIWSQIQIRNKQKNHKLRHLMTQGTVTDTQSFIANLVITITTTATMVATTVVLIKFLRNKDLWNFEYFLIASLCAGDFIQASSIGIPTIYYWVHPITNNEQYSDSNMCLSQGFFQLLGCLFQFTWTFNITYSAYRGIWLETQEQYKRRKVKLIALGTLVPIGLSILPLVTNTFGQSALPLVASVCFIQTGLQHLGGNIVIMTTFGLPMILVFFTNLYLVRKVCKVYRETTMDVESSFERQLMVYPMILLLCQGWFWFYFICNVIFDVNWFNYEIWCFFSSNLTGVFDSIAYGLNSSKIERSQGVNAYSLLSQPLQSTLLLQSQQQSIEF